MYFVSVLLPGLSFLCAVLVVVTCAHCHLAIAGHNGNEWLNLGDRAAISAEKEISRKDLMDGIRYKVLKITFLQICT